MRVDPNLQSSLRGAVEALRDLAARFVSLPGALKLSSVGAAVLVFGALTPWEKSGGDALGAPTTYQLGVEFNGGAITVAIGLLAAFLLAATAQRNSSQRGGEAGLGLVAIGIVAAELIQIVSLPSVDGHTLNSVSWGLYISGAGAVMLLLGGVALLGNSDSRAEAN